MKPLNVLLVFLVLAIPLVIMNDAKRDNASNQQVMQKQYSEEFQSAVDDAGSYLARLELQQTASAVHYQREKQLEAELEVWNVFYMNLAIKYGLEQNPTAIENLKLHMPAQILFGYDGYHLITLSDKADDSSQAELSPFIWPKKPYWTTLTNGNLIYFTLDDQATVYDRQSNRFLEGSYDELAGKTDLRPLTSIELFREVKQSSILSSAEADLAAAINRHMGLVKRMGLALSFTLPRDLGGQAIQDVSVLAFIQGYPLPGGDTLEAFSLGSGSVVRQSGLTGMLLASGKKMAYGNTCMPTSGASVIESLFDEEEAARKGYFVDDCGPAN
ncbi:hypothetical protein [Paenibacillus herberti]|uniref:F0F1-type ATP synthase n=1 Tax=Paenibacillus herberti TaxID=1619309 RepID=A0A229P0K8_9BACL|nr:hypothetical protein [Paenibacillus herberti]OXM15551.1 hypothetical protein CGZ75_02090 [Paenibacillus herberti]